VDGPGAAPDATWSWTFDAAGLLAQTQDPEGVEVTYSYDDAGRLVGLEDALGNTRTFTLDPIGNRLSESSHDPGLVLTQHLSRVYSAIGRLTDLRNAQNQATTFTYDGQGNELTATDPRGIVTTSTYDGLNRVKQVVQDSAVGGIQATTQFTYDIRDKLTQVKDPKLLNTTYTYNGYGDLLTQVSPDTGTTTHTYDAAGRLATTTDARGVTVTHSYDGLGRLTTLDYPTASPDRDVAFFYDETDLVTGCSGSYPIGRRTRMTDETGTTTWCYDHRGQVTSRTQTDGAVSFTTAWTYDTAGRLTQMTYPSGHVVDLSHDAAGQVEHLDHTDGSNLVTTRLVDQAIHLPFGPLTGWAFPGSQDVAYTYDANHWMTGISTPALTLDFVRDEIGNLVEMTTGSTADQRVITVDGLSRITQVQTGALANLETFTYDDTGNRLSKTVGAGSPVSYTYPGSSHRLTSVGGAARTFNASGSLATEGGKTYTHDDRQRLVQVANGGGTLLQAGYNGLGERVKKVGTAGTEWFVFGQQGEILGRYDASGSLIQEFVWLGSRPVGVKQGSGMGIPYASELLAVHSDQLGSPRAVVRLAGSPANQVVWAWDWRSGVFGEGAPTVDPDGDLVGFDLGLRFPGQWLDGETGLHYNYFRDYEPGVGRYVQSDPIGLRGGVGTYPYAMSNSALFTYSLGLFSCITTVDCACIKDPKNCAVASPKPAPTPKPVPLITPVIDREIYWPEKMPGNWVCKARADCNDNIVGNCPDAPNRRFSFGGGFGPDLGSARNMAKSNATHNLCCQPKRVSCKCISPTGERYSGGC